MRLFYSCTSVHHLTSIVTIIITFLLTYFRTYILTYIVTYFHTYLPTYLLTYIHTYLHIYVRTYLLIYYLLTATESSLGRRSPYTSTNKQIRIDTHKRNNTKKTRYKQYKTQ